MSASWRTAEWWAKQLMKRLLSITHKHKQTNNGSTETQKYTSKRETGKGKQNREYWVAEMETAIESARRHDNPIMMDHAGNIVYSHGETIGTEPLQFEPPLVDTEGSIRFTRRKKKY